MPIYNYICEECGTPFEVFYRTIGEAEREEPQEKCPKCDSPKKRRAVTTGTSFKLKGSGWYSTDSGKKTKGQV